MPSEVPVLVMQIHLTRHRLTWISSLYVKVTGATWVLWSMLFRKTPRSHDSVALRVRWTTVLTESFVPGPLPCASAGSCFHSGRGWGESS